MYIYCIFILRAFFFFFCIVHFTFDDLNIRRLMDAIGKLNFTFPFSSRLHFLVGIYKMYYSIDKEKPHNLV